MSKNLLKEYVKTWVLLDEEDICVINHHVKKCMNITEDFEILGELYDNHIFIKMKKTSEVIDTNLTLDALRQHSRGWSNFEISEIINIEINRGGECE